MPYWGIGMLLLGGGAIAAAIQNWDWWFRINSASGKFVHDSFGRTFARQLNFLIGVVFVVVGFFDVTGQWPISAVLNAWVSDDPTPIEEYLSPAPPQVAPEQLETTNPTGLPSYAQ